ncbi:MAG: twin-arginine translocase TatA/TatE family subunit, partial [Desulfotignum sp.]
MFGLGMPEILLILAIALIVIGPQKLPDLAKTLGRAMGEFKRSAQDLKRSIDMDTTLQDVKSTTTDLKDVIKDSKKKNHQKESAEKEAAEESKNKDTGSDDTAPSSSENTTAGSATDKEDSKNG